MRLRALMKRSLSVSLGIMAVALIGLGLYGAVLSATLTLPEGDDHPPLLIYGGPFLLQPNLHLQEAHLLERLDRLGYRPVAHDVAHPGEFRLTDEALDISLHEFQDLSMRASPIRLHLDQGKVTTITSLETGDEVFPISLEPQLISGMRGESRQVREWIPLAEIPPRVVDTVLLIEDRRFYSHPGIDPIAVGRALWANVIKGSVTQGGSTITQQLAKNLFYSPQRTWTRKLKESVAAFVLEAKYRKQDILESYLNEIYLGQVGSVSVYGVGEAAHRYFGKELQDLTSDETALIVGMIKGPNSYSPIRNPTLAKERRNVVLRRMHDQGLLADDQLQATMNMTVQVVQMHASLADAPYFVDYLMHLSEETTGMALPDGTRVYTTLDPVLQRLAGEALAAGLAKLEATYPHLKRPKDPLQGALIALNPKTGGILAMVGGRDYRASQFNRAVQAKRQPGSLFKPFVYLAAFEAGRNAGGQALTPISTVVDEPVTFESGGDSWSPQNYDRQFRGSVTLRAALEQSLNVPAVRVAQGAGVKRIVQLAHGLGIQSPLANDLSLALGSTAVSLLEVTSAYGTLANSGVAIPPTPIREVVSATGDQLWYALTQRHEAASPQAVYLVTSLLKGVVDRGTAAKARTMGLQGIVAGKTGTTDGYRDAWFVGYTPDVAIGVWIGFDDEQPIRLTGSQAALPIWTEFARQIIPSDSPEFVMPSGVVEREIDPTSSQLATSKCPERVTEVFVEGTQPTVYCEIHGEGLFERLRHTFGFS